MASANQKMTRKTIRFKQKEIERIERIAASEGITPHAVILSIVRSALQKAA